MSLTKFDELNTLVDSFKETFAENSSFPLQEKEDILLDLLIFSYVSGVGDANASLGTNLPPDMSKMEQAIYKKIKGEDFRERLVEGDVVTIATTESHRVYNQGVLDIGIESNLNINKTWVTRMDGKVRDTHYYLEGQTIPLNDRFYTYDGDSAEYPGGFDLAQNNVNCRCTIELNVE